MSKTMNKLDYINEAKKVLKVGTDADLAKKLEVTRQSVSLWRNGSTSPDEYACFRIAKILMIDPRKVIADIKSETEKDENKRSFWVEKSKEYGFISIGYALFSYSCSFVAGVIFYILCKIGHTSYQAKNFC